MFKIIVFIFCNVATTTTRKRVVVQNSFNGFAHKPIDYAKKVNCSTLILQGELDRTVNLQKIKDLQQNINAAEKLVIFPQAGHQSLLTVDRKLWQENVEDFLDDL